MDRKWTPTVQSDKIFKCMLQTSPETKFRKRDFIFNVVENVLFARKKRQSMAVATWLFLYVHLSNFETFGTLLQTRFWRGYFTVKEIAIIGRSVWQDILQLRDTLQRMHMCAITCRLFLGLTCAYTMYMYSGSSILQPSILWPALNIRPLDLVPNGNFLC